MPRLLLAALALLLAAPSTVAQTDVSGSITANTTWGTAGSPYTVTNTVTVEPGVTLTVQDGVEVRFVNGRSLVVQGQLTASGTTFTADADTPGRSTWGDIRVDAGAVATLTNTTIEYADQAIRLFEGGTATLGGVTIRNVRVGVEADPADAVGSREYDVWASGGLSLTDVVVVDSYVIAYFNTPVPYTVSGDNSFTGNDFEAIFVQFYAHRGTWTVPAGPTIVWWFVNGAISDTLVLEPGAVVKSQNRRRRVRQLTAVGEVGDPIVVTAYNDDSVGGDANNNVSTAAPGQAGELEVLEQATVQYAEFRFGDAGGLRLDGAEGGGGMTATVRDTDFIDAQVGLYIASADVTVEDNTFSGITQYPVEVGVGVRGSIDPAANAGLLAYLPTRFTLSGAADAVRRDTLYDLGLTYVLVGATRVGAFAELTVNAGVVVKSRFSNGIDIEGGGALFVEGSAADPVIFTSWQDDSAGSPGDLNEDGNTTTPGPNDWDGLYFQPGSVGVLDQAEVRYASRTSFFYVSRSYSRGAVNVAEATVTVRDSRLANARFGLVAVGASALAVEGTTFNNIEQAPLALDLSVTPTFTGNAMENVGLSALGIVGPVRASATLPQRDFAGVTNITYALLNDLTVEEGVEVTVSPGVVIKSFGYLGIGVDGGLRLAGTAADPIVLTEYRDDSIGNPRDTNGDGNESAPSAGSWQGVYYRRTTNDAASPVSDAQIRYAATGLALSEADLRVSDVEISNVGNRGVGGGGGPAPPRGRRGRPRHGPDV